MGKQNSFTMEENKMSTQQAIQVEGTEKISIEKKGMKFEFTEGLFNGYPEMKVFCDGHNDSVTFVNDEKILFQFGLKLQTGKVGGLSSSGIDMEKYAKVKLLYEDIQKRKKEQKQKEEDEKYAPLYEKMEKISLPKKNENPNDEKCQEILKTLKSGFSTSDPENEGLNIAVSSGNAKIRQEAQKHCDHDFETSFFRTYTADTRKQLTRHVKCEKCGLFHQDTVKDETVSRWI